MDSVQHYKAVADETRLRLLNLLLRHELSVGEIVAVMEMGQSRISRHLKILTDCGLLNLRRDGLWAFYTASREGRGGAFNGLFREFTADDRSLERDYAAMKAVLEEGSRNRERFFDSIASDWDDIRHRILGGLNIGKEVTARIRDCRVAADLGCGTGGLLIALRKRARKVIGVDRSPRMLDEARKRLAGNGRDIELRLGEIEHLPMRDGEADAAVVNMVLHHLPAPVEGVAEAGRVVRKGGELIIVDLDKHANEEMRKRYHHRWLGFEQGQMAGFLSRCGFAVKERAAFQGGQGLTVALFRATRE